MLRVSSSIVDAVRATHSSYEFVAFHSLAAETPMLRLLHGLVWLVAALRRRATARFGAFLDPAELLTPEALERAGPLVQGPERPGVRAIQHPTAVATCPHETDVAQHAQMLRDRRLRQSERIHDLAHRALVGRQKVEDRPAPGLCDRVERIRARGGARHP